MKPRGWAIEIADLEKAVDKNTKLVALSKISYINGFEHDLKAVCDLAHAHGAYVYADVVQAVGCMPLNVRESNIDFVASASYKWLMGDFGLGFVYVRKDLLPKLQRTQMELSAVVMSLIIMPFPGDPAGAVSGKLYAA